MARVYYYGRVKKFESLNRTPFLNALDYAAFRFRYGMDVSPC